MKRLLLLALLLAWAQAARAQDAVPPAWRGAYDFLVASVCADAHDRAVPGVSPLDGFAACPHPRKLRLGERLPYHKRDWPGLLDRAAQPEGYQESDSFPARSALGVAVVQTFDFGDAVRRFGQFDSGDGGQVAFFSANSASVGVTEDGGAGLQFFIGPGCTPLDGWVIVDSSFATAPSGATVARIGQRQAGCPQRLGFAATRWHVEPIRLRIRRRGVAGSTVLTTLVSDHFGGRDPATADHLERMYFTRELGLTRWERWQDLGVRDRTEDRRQAAVLADSGRCAAALGAPPEGGPWVMIDCREWTGIVPPNDPAGDPPTFWLDRLQHAPATAALFAP
jgi:hypothetical protein